MTTDSQATCACLINDLWRSQAIPTSIELEPGSAIPTSIELEPGPIRVPPLKSQVTLTEPEKTTLLHLREAWNDFIKMDNISTDDINEFRDAIHRTQQIIATRVARRADPDVWRQPE